MANTQGQVEAWRAGIGVTIPESSTWAIAIMGLLTTLVTAAKRQRRS
jgi:hypothetical protein